MPTTFPTFERWPRYKLFFLRNMSLKQKGQDKHDVIIVTEEMERNFPRCRMCSEKLNMCYDVDVEDWVYRDCKISDGVPYHFPLCWDYALLQ